MFKKLKQKAKNLLVAVLSVTTAGSGLAASAVQEVSAAGGWTLSYDGGDYGSGVAYKRGDGSPYNYLGLTFYRMTNSNTGESVITFCTQMEVGTYHGASSYETGVAGNQFSALPVDVQRRISRAGNWFFTYHNGEDAARAATQLYIWDQTFPYASGGDSSGWAWSDMISHSPNQALANAAKTRYDELIAYINNMGTRPNFNIPSGKLVMNPGDSRTFTDSNGVFHLQEYQLNTAGLPSKVHITKNGDSITISVDADYVGVFDATATVGIQFKNLIDAGNKTYFFSSSETMNNSAGIYSGLNLNLQGMIYPAGVPDPYNLDLDLRVVSGKIRVEKYDKLTNETLSGAEFKVTRKSDGEEVATLSTNNNGYAETDWLKYDDYVVTETKAPKGFNLSDPVSKDVTLNSAAGEVVTVEFYNKVIQAPVFIHKVNGDHPDQDLSGVEFEVHQTSNYKGGGFDEVVDTLTTDANGEALSKLLDYGDYYLKETKAKYGFYNDQTIRNFSVTKEMVTVTYDGDNVLTNVIPKTKITVTKQDDNSDECGIDSTTGEKIKLPGARFQLYEHVVRKDVMGNILDEGDQPIGDPITTDENGEAVIDRQLALSEELQQQGSYYFVRELSAPFGYYLSQNPDQRVEITYTDQYEATIEAKPIFENEVMKGKIKVIKVDKENNVVKLPGAQFNIINNDCNNKIVDTITTNANGEATTKKLRPGNYTVEEVAAPANYQLNSEAQRTSIELQKAADNSPIIYEPTVTFENLHEKGTIEVTKVDGLTLDYQVECEDENDESTCKRVGKETADTLYLKDVEFAVYTQDNLDEPVAKMKTDENGKASVTLNTGKYYLQEIKAPEGYNVNPTLIPINLVRHGDVAKELVVDMPFYGEIKAYKIGEALVGTKEGEDGTTELVWKDTYKKDVVFEVYAEEDIKHPITKKVIYKKDELVSRLVTDGTGEATLSELPLGKYYVKEITAPEEHSIYNADGDEVKHIELTENDADVDGVVKSESTFKNERIIVDPAIYKQAANLKNKSDESEGYDYTALAGAKFGIYNVDKISSDDNKVTVNADTLLAVMTTDEDGKADVEVKLPFGKYYIKEIEAPDGYFLDEEKHPFELVWKKDMQEKRVLNVKVADEDNPITNYEIPEVDTGVNNTTKLMIGMATIAVGGVSILLVNRRKKVTE